MPLTILRNNLNHVNSDAIILFSILRLLAGNLTPVQSAQDLPAATHEDFAVEYYLFPPNRGCHQHAGQVVRISGYHRPIRNSETWRGKIKNSWH